MFPLMNVNGKNATIDVRTVATTGHSTWLAPSTAACIAGTPFSCCALIFSATTIASSTRSPKTKISANIVSIFKVTPNNDIMNNVPPRAVIKPMPTQRATRQFRASSNKMKTKKPPYSAFSVSRFMRPSTKRAKSVNVESDAPSGKGLASTPNCHAFCRAELPLKKISFQSRSNESPILPATYARTISAILTIS